MKRYSLSRFLKWGPVLAAASVVLVAPGCDDDDPFGQEDGPAGAGVPGGTTGGGTAGTDGTSGGSGGTTGGTAGNGSSSGGTTGAGGNGTTGAVDDGGWCAVKAVMDEYCVACHDGQGSAGTPMGLTSYEDLMAEAVGRSGVRVFERVRVRMHPDLAQAEGLSKMPPQGNPTAEELAAVDAWVAAGAPPAADPTCSGSAGGSEPVVDDWPPAECDEIHEFRAYQPGDPSSPLRVERGPDGNPNVYPRGVTFDAPWGDENVQAIAFHPIIDNKAVLHHWILYSGGGGGGFGGAFITGWAPGDDERSPLPDDVGMQMPSSMYLDLHYYNNETSPQTDRSGVAICIVKGEKLRPNAAGVTMNLSQIFFNFPIGDSTRTTVTGTCDVVANNGPVTLLTASPHSHTYGVHHRFTVTKKDGTDIVMLDAPFIYGEQASYRLDPPVQVETGDTITTTCVFSGVSADAKVTKANADRESVGFGQETEDEMCFNFATYYPVNGFCCRNSLGCSSGGGGLGGLLGF